MVDGPRGVFVGQLCVLYELTNALRELGGRVGYDMRPSAGWREYASAMLRAGLQVGRGRHVDPARVTCDDSTVVPRLAQGHRANGGQLQFWVSTPPTEQLAGTDHDLKHPGRVLNTSTPSRHGRAWSVTARKGVRPGMARRDYVDDPNAPAANSVVPSVVAVVRNEDGYLLMIHRTDNGLWALPGGGHDIGESISDTVVREVREETGIDVEVTGLVGLYTNPNHVMAYDDGEVRQQFSICFTARPVGGALRTSGESREVAWVAPARLDALTIHPSMRLRIAHALADLPRPYIG